MSFKINLCREIFNISYDAAKDLANSVSGIIVGFCRDFFKNTMFFCKHDLN